TWMRTRSVVCQSYCGEFMFDVVFFFFFSSRRRHTRLVSDWSSDVCSSDLHARRLLNPKLMRMTAAAARITPPTSICTSGRGGDRSEERRVGKEWRSRWAACQLKKTVRSPGEKVAGSVHSDATRRDERAHEG